MKRRTFLGSLATGAVVSAVGVPQASASIAKMKITRVRAYLPPNPNPLFNQSDMVVTVETDAGITGIGEGGSKDTLSQSAGRLIGQDPQYIERLWQDMNRAFFYPAGREKTHAIGALDLALWDIKGKTLGLPVHRLLGGMVRNHCECYNTAGIIPRVTEGMSIKERAHATIEAGYRAFRMGAMDLPANTTFNTMERINHLREECSQAREGVGTDGDWAIDFHQRFDLADAIRGCKEIEDLAPFFVEDPVRTEAFQQDLPILRSKVNVPLAAGEEWGNRWDFNKRAGDVAQRWRHHRNDENRGDLRNAFCGDRSTLYRPDSDCGAGEQPGHLFRSGTDGIQLSGALASPSASVLGFQERKAVSE
jgi:galactonate dehydratase